ncbi:MAG: S41 family peptidase [Rhodospirillales bacterium]|nr:S41 family peptidase [Rhodospirillales bacterium]
MLPAPLGAEIERHCPADGTRCAAQLIVNRLPAARLVRVNHPNTDTIRRAHTVPSVSVVKRRGDGTLVVVLDRFGRTADREVADAIVAAGPPVPERVVLDLRGNGGGDFDRMRRVASLFTGPRDRALRLRDRSGMTDVALPQPLRAIGEFEIDVLIGPATASSAEVLAALLRRYAGARLIGAPTLGKDWLTRLVPVDHDWRLAVPAERIEVPGETLAQGLVPDIEAAPDEPHAHE